MCSVRGHGEYSPRYGCGICERTAQHAERKLDKSKKRSRNQPENKETNNNIPDKSIKSEVKNGQGGDVSNMNEKKKVKN
jgi:hypothetical protein